MFSLRHLTAKTLAQQFAKDFEKEFAPFWYALSTRARTDCVGHLFRAATDANLRATILIAGMGTYDHVLRATMLSKLEQMPNVKALIPFMMLSCPESCTYDGVEDTRNHTSRKQTEPLMPLLFSMGIQGSLGKCQSLWGSEACCAFLDDIYFLCELDRVKPAFDFLEQALMRQPHQGNTSLEQKRHLLWTSTRWKTRCGRWMGPK